MKTCLTLLLIFLSCSIYSQDYKFGKVSKEELLQSADSNDSALGAVMLYRKHHISSEIRSGKGRCLIIEVQ